jgi:hypothetical protein
MIEIGNSGIGRPNSVATSAVRRVLSLAEVK